MKNREILFRGELIHSNEWIEGNLIIARNGQPYIIPFEIFEPDGHHLIIDSDSAFWVIPETVGQFTGLTDKNGVKIFDGDVVYCDGLGECTVYFNKQMASFRLMSVDVYSDTTRISYGFEETEPSSEIVVTGDIYNNQKLCLQ